jgi:chromate transporter
MSQAQTNSDERLSEVVKLFGRLGVSAFGGPAAHIALMHDEVVNRRKWLTEAEFLDLLGATNLIPGPNSTEMAIHISYRMAGWIGMLAGGGAFILPSTIMALGLAWAYVSFGTTPAAGDLLAGIQPIVILLIGQAIIHLGRMAVKGWLTAVIGLAALLLYFVPIEPLILMIIGGLIVMLAANLSRLRAESVGLVMGGSITEAVQKLPLLAEPFSVTGLFLTFLKIGSVLYGSGYVLFAFIQSDLVTRLGWLTERQLIDAIAAGQITPGPLSSTATFIGYVLGGIPGAIAATLGMFLPPFIFVAISSPLIPRIRQSSWAGAFLDGVNVAALGLMAAVTAQLAQTAFVVKGQLDWIAIVEGLIAAFVLVSFKVNSIWLILAGALIGLMRWMLG